MEHDNFYLGMNDREKEELHMHVLPVHSSSYGTVTHLAIPIPDLPIIAYDKNGLPRLATAASAESKLKTAEPQAYVVCFAKRRIVDLVCPIQPCLMHKRACWGKEPMVRRGCDAGPPVFPGFQANFWALQVERSG